MGGYENRPMRFHLLDRIVDCQPGKVLRGLKRLTGGEEYLADHFPGFPIMPGVLQLQSLVEAASWLLRLTDDYRYSVVVLREVKSVRFGNLMQPGKALEVCAELTERDGAGAAFKARGEAEGTQTVSAQFSLGCYNLRDRNPALADRDERLVRHWKSLYQLLSGQLAQQSA
jgi:3-hydroxyacyl-[acyl-carrier-protein] dehydratase